MLDLERDVKPQNMNYKRWRGVGRVINKEEAFVQINTLSGSRFSLCKYILKIW